MPALSDLERQILDYMVQYLRANTYQPSVREIGEQFHIKSTKTVSEHLRALADKGYLERDPSRSRGVRILGVDLNAETVSVPCYSTFPDDRSGYQSDGVEARYTIDRQMAGAEGTYFVRARGAELSGLDIFEGDYLLVEPVTAEDVGEGDLVVVRRPRGNELFRYSRNGSGAHLKPARAGAEVVTVAADGELDVLGRVTGLFRSFDRAGLSSSSTTH